jgi:hypothetical protein
MEGTMNRERPSEAEYDAELLRGKYGATHEVINADGSKRTVPTRKHKPAAVAIREVFAQRDELQRELSDTQLALEAVLEQRDELHRLWDASAAEARRKKAQRDELLAAAKAFLDKIDSITSEQFAHGEEAPERYAMRAAIAKAEGSKQ